jgi:hypothetical protein
VKPRYALWPLLEFFSSSSIEDLVSPLTRSATT